MFCTSESCAFCDIGVGQLYVIYIHIPVKKHNNNTVVFIFIFMQSVSKLRNIFNKVSKSSIALRVNFVSNPISAGKRIPVSLLSVAKSNTKTVLIS